jgi:hypothetical protein
VLRWHLRVFFTLLSQLAPLSWSRAQESHTAKLIDAQMFGHQ